MMTEDKEKFYFVPISKKKKINPSFENCTAALTRSGTLRLNVNTTRCFVGDMKFVKVLLDQEKRTIALLFASEIRPDKLWRKIWTYGGQTLISIGNIARLLDVKGHNITGLLIKKYNDSEYGEVIYFKVPRIKSNES